MKKLLITALVVLLLLILGVYFLDFSSIFQKKEVEQKKILIVPDSDTSYKEVSVPLQDSNLDIDEFEIVYENESSVREKIFDINNDENVVSVLSYEDLYFATQNDVGLYLLKGETRDIIANNQSLFQLVAMKDSGIISIEDIKGKKISIPGELELSTLLLKNLLVEKYNYSLSDFEFESMNPTIAPNMLEDGDYDLLLIHPYYILHKEAYENYVFVLDVGLETFEHYETILPNNFISTQANNFQDNDEIYYLLENYLNQIDLMNFNKNLTSEKAKELGYPEGFLEDMSTYKKNLVDISLKDKKLLNDIFKNILNISAEENFFYLEK